MPCSESSMVIHRHHHRRSCRWCEVPIVCTLNCFLPLPTLLHRWINLLLMPSDLLPHDIGTQETW